MRPHLLLLASLLAVGAGCGPSPAPAPLVAAPLVTVAPAPDEPAAEPASSEQPRKRPEAPAGYVELQVGGVMSTPGGHAVVLVDAERRTAVPIFVGGTEALAIELRHNRKRFTRPLTHDLLDEVMRRVGVELREIHIDAIKDDTFLGTIVLHHGDTVIELDARPSDAIALALGSGAPIFVATKVIERAGIQRQEVLPDDPSADPSAQPQPI